MPGSNGSPEGLTGSHGPAAAENQATGGREFPGLNYAAALLGPGSDVAGFDTERSTDHDWGPRLQVLLDDSDADRHAASLTEMLAGRLPEGFRGYPRQAERGVVPA